MDYDYQEAGLAADETPEPVTPQQETFTRADRLALAKLVGSAITARGEYGAACYFTTPDKAEASHAAALLAEDVVMALIHRIPTTD